MKLLFYSTEAPDNDSKRRSTRQARFHSRTTALTTAQLSLLPPHHRHAPSGTIVKVLKRHGEVRKLNKEPDRDARIVFSLHPATRLRIP